MHPICDLQIEYSLISRGIEQAILPTCRELGIGITAYGVLSRGLISGSSCRRRPGDIRGRMPRFRDENLRRNLELVEQLRAIAEQRGVSPTQLAIAWVLSRGEDIVPLIGARRRDQLTEALGALELQLTSEELERIERAVPADAVAGDALRRGADGAPGQRALNRIECGHERHSRPGPSAPLTAASCAWRSPARATARFWSTTERRTPAICIPRGPKMPPPAERA